MSSLDLVIAVVVVAYAVSGYLQGFVVNLVATAGLVLGGLGAIWVVPHLLDRQSGTLTTSLLSLSTGRRVKPNLAMTGEVTVTGRVLPIGGVREKTVAAKRANINELIFPADNRGDFEELPDYIREGVTAHFVETYDEVYDLAFV